MLVTARGEYRYVKGRLRKTAQLDAWVGTAFSSQIHRCRQADR